MDRISLENQSSNWIRILVMGPESGKVLSNLGWSIPPSGKTSMLEINTNKFDLFQPPLFTL